MRSIISFLFFLYVGLNYVVAQSSSPTFTDQYSKKYGNLRMTSTRFDLGHVKNNEMARDTIRIYNAGRKPINILISPKLPVWIKMNVKGSPLYPAGYGYISINYDALRKGDLGFVMDQVQINTDDTLFPLKMISVAATIEEYFPPAVCIDSLRAKASIEEYVFSYGRIMAGQKIVHDFKIINSGKKALQFRKIKTNCSCIKASFTKKEVPAGDTAEVHVEFDSIGKEGNDSRTIYLYSNDCDMPEVRFDLKGEVVK